MRPPRVPGAQIAVDAQKATEDAIVQQVRGSDIIGSKVVLTVRKGGLGQIFDVALVRGAWGAVERKEKLFILFDELQKLIQKEAPRDLLEVRDSSHVQVLSEAHSAD